MSHYAQLTRDERYQIYASKTAGQNKTEIAKVLGRHKTTVGREMTRNRGLKGYRPKQVGGDRYRHLRCQKQRKKRYGAPDRRGHIKGRVSIDERPDVVNKRSRIGERTTPSLASKGALCWSLWWNARHALA